MKKETDINIDALLRDTFLTVVELRQGTTVRHGMELYRHCQRQVEGVRERLKDAGFSRESVEHITYAQCALLDAGSGEWHQYRRFARKPRPGY